MANQSLIVIDNFYDNPDAIRALALSSEYNTKRGGTYPGIEAIAKDVDWSSSWKKLRSYIEEDVDAPCPLKDGFPQGKFRLAMKEHEADRIDLVHEDVHRWSGVVYLSLPEHCQGGIAYYKHKKTGALSSTPEWFAENYPELLTTPRDELQKKLLSIFKDESQWEKIGEVPMLYNRAIIIMAQCFHGSTGIFGTSKETARITQNFQFYTPTDHL